MDFVFPICLANFAVLFMVAAVGVALPAMQQDLGGSAVELSWVAGAYTLALAMVFVPVARVVDIWGYRRLFRLALLGLATTGAILTVSPNLPFVIAVRVVQAVAGATANTASLAMLAVGVDSHRRGAAMGWLTAALYAGLALGPLAGGVLVELWGWRSIFAVSVPLVVAAWAFSARIPGEWRPRAGQGLDVLGAVLCAGAVAAWLLALAAVDQPQRLGQLLVTAVLLSWWFVRRMTHSPDPLVDVAAVASNRILVFSLVATAINYASTFCVGFLVSIVAQAVRGLSPTQAGMLLAVPPVVQTLGSPWVGRMADRLPAPWIASAGMAVGAVSLALLAQGAASLSLLGLTGVLGLQGLGFALFASPNMTVILGAVEPRAYALASSLTGAMRTMGMAASMAGIAVAFRAFLGEAPVHAAAPEALVGSMATVLGGAAFLSVLGVGLSLGRVRWRRG